MTTVVTLQLVRLWADLSLQFQTIQKHTEKDPLTALQPELLAYRYNYSTVLRGATELS